MKSDDLLDFSEAAALLGVNAEKVRRLVVEDRTITAVRLSTDGQRYTVDLDAFRSGNFRIDERGCLLIGLPVYEQRAMVGTDYQPFDVPGGLRIGRTELERYLSAMCPASELAAPSSVETASRAAPASATGQRPGLDPTAIAAAFAGCWGTEMQWIARLSKLGAKSWLNRPPVVVRRGVKGKGQAGNPVPTCRDPVEVAKGIVKLRHALLQDMSRQFRTSVELKPWKEDWAEYAGWGRAE